MSRSAARNRPRPCGPYASTAVQAVGDGPAAGPRIAETGMSSWLVDAIMCQYCNWAFHDGWGELLKYDETYQSAVGTDTESTHGFHDEWDDLRSELGI